MVEEEQEDVNTADTLIRYLLKDGIDIASKTISIEGTINHKASIRFDRQLKLLETMTEGQINVYVNSGGGDVYAMFAIIDRMECSPNQILTIGTGLVASAALPILAAGNIRMVTKNCTLMHHTASYSVGNSRMPTQKNELQHVTKLENRVCKYLTAKSQKPYNFWTATGKHLDYYFDADEAVEMGVVDEILS